MAYLFLFALVLVPLGTLWYRWAYQPVQQMKARWTCWKCQAVGQAHWVGLRPTCLHCGWRPGVDETLSGATIPDAHLKRDPSSVRGMLREE